VRGAVDDEEGDAESSRRLGYRVRRVRRHVLHVSWTPSVRQHRRAVEVRHALGRVDDW
jgi:hypothetical protein